MPTDPYAVLQALLRAEAARSRRAADVPSEPARAPAAAPSPAVPSAVPERTRRAAPGSVPPGSAPAGPRPRREPPVR
ncbi:hypothetical protein [Streptomyces filamentosus]|uniref:hypothetical protein n=1 Tax=Streptomyces filamentosus TaxID=67294 RepID=UPI00123AD021|nr:hypothetical protein [Streptomyces filamentosus]KAA6211151.1 hypothetical protein CP979_32405 [Streptomyces filamentosus]